MKSIHELPLSLGIHSTYKGYHYLVTALELAIQNEDNLIFVTKNIFPIVARKYHTNVHCVERNIRTIILNCWNSPYRKTLQEIAPCPLYKPPSVGEFIDILFWKIKSYEGIEQTKIGYISTIVTETSIITRTNVITECEIQK